MIKNLFINTLCITFKYVSWLKIINKLQMYKYKLKNIIIIIIPQFCLEAYVKTLSVQFFDDNVQHDHVQAQQMFLSKYKGHFHNPIKYF